MRQAKADKLTKDLAGFLMKLRTEAVRMEGRTKVAIQVDAKRPEEKAALAGVLSFATGLLKSLDDQEKELPKLGAALGDPEPAAPATTAKK